MAKNQLAFPVVAIDQASRTFERIARSVEQLNRRLDRLEARKAAEINVAPDANRVDKSEQSISRLSGTLAKLGGVLASVGKLGIKGAQFSIMAAGAAAAAGQLAGLAASLAPAVGILAGLPALLAVRGAAMATFAVGLSGVSAAIDSAFNDKLSKFEEKIEDLGPSAQKTMRALRELVPWFKGLKASVQDSLFKDFDVVLKNIANTLLGPVGAGMKRVAHEANLVVKGMADIAMQGASVSLVDNTFGVLAGIIAQCREPLLRLAEAFIGAANAGMGSIGQLGGGIAGLIDKFAAWLQAATDAGKITEWIGGAVTVFKQLWDIASPIAGIIASIGTAASASGGNLLGTIGQLLGVVDAFLKTAEGEQFLTSLFGTLNTIGTALGPVIAAIGTGLAGVLPFIGQIATALGPGLTALITNLGAGLAALAPSLVPLAKNISDWAVAIAPILPLVGELIGLFVGALAPVVRVLATQVGKIFEAAKPAIEKIVPLVGEFAGLLAGVLGEALVAVGGLLAELLPPILELAAVLIEQMLPVWRSMAGKIGDLLPLIVDLVLKLADMLLPVIEDLLPLWLSMQQAIAGGVLDAVIALVPAIIALVDAAMPFVGIATELASILLVVLSGALQWVIGLVVGLIDIVADLVVGIVDMTQPIRDAASTLKEKLGDAVEWVQDKMDEALKWWGDLGTTIKDAVGDLGETLKQAGKDLLQGFMDGIESNKPQLQQLLGGITGLLPQWKGPPEKDRKILAPSGQMAMSGFMDGIESQVPALRAQLGGITGLIGNDAAVATGVSGIAAAALPTPPQDIRLVLVLEGDEDLVRMFRRSITNRGGLDVVFE